MPIIPEGQTTGGALGDLFGGVNRPQLNAFVANSQARNGLVSAQTQDAMIKAQQGQEEEEARGKIDGQLAAMYPDMKPSERALTAAAMGGVFGSNEASIKALGLMAAGHGTPQEQALGTQQATGKALDPAAVPANYMPTPGGVFSGAPVQQSLQGAAQTADTASQTALRSAQAAAGGFNPHVGGLGGASSDHIAALNNAVRDGRLDPKMVNSRTASIFGEMELRNPGETNFNRLAADAALQRNAGFQQKSIGLEALPTIMSHMTSLGKKIGYSDNRTVGQMQQWAKGEFNDPDYTEYMTVRNDALMKVASLMRGVGMSDKAHEAEIQAAAPTLSPLALDGWLKGQMATLEPLLASTERVTHLGDKSYAPAGKAASAPTQVPLGEGLPGQSAAPTPAALPSYASEAAALAAGHKRGDRVQIGGVSGTLQ